MTGQGDHTYTPDDCVSSDGLTCVLEEEHGLLDEVRAAEHDDLEAVADCRVDVSLPSLALTDRRRPAPLGLLSDNTDTNESRGP